MLSKLPNDLLSDVVFSFLTVEACGSVAQVSKTCHLASQNFYLLQGIELGTVIDRVKKSQGCGEHAKISLENARQLIVQNPKPSLYFLLEQVQTLSNLNHSIERSILTEIIKDQRISAIFDEFHFCLKIRAVKEKKSPYVIDHFLRKKMKELIKKGEMRRAIVVTRFMDVFLQGECLKKVVINSCKEGKFEFAKKIARKVRLRNVKTDCYKEIALMEGKRGNFIKAVESVNEMHCPLTKKLTLRRLFFEAIGQSQGGEAKRIQNLLSS